MKAGLSTSFIMHVALIGAGLVTLRAPAAMNVEDVEALPIDIVSISELTQMQQGDKTAPLKDKPAPAPTQRQDRVADAENVGEQEVDRPNTPEPKVEPKPAPPTPEVAPQPTPKPTPVKVEPPKPAEPKPQEPEPKPAEPTTELAPEPKAEQEIAPDPAPEKAEPLPEEEAKPEFASLPDAAPVPAARPQPPKPQTAKTPDRKVEPKTDVASKQADNDEKKIEDEVAALLNREKTSGGGAKRSQEEASLGAKKTNKGTKLTLSEMDALRGQIQRCWNVPAGIEDSADLRVSVKFKLKRDGTVDGRPEIVRGGGASGPQRTAQEAAKRAVLRCGQGGYQLPADKYEAWQEVVVNFDPSEMF